VVYFADDDNTYSTAIFDEVIKFGLKIEFLGMPMKFCVNSFLASKPKKMLATN